MADIIKIGAATKIKDNNDRETLYPANSITLAADGDDIVVISTHLGVQLHVFKFNDIENQQGQSSAEDLVEFYAQNNFFYVPGIPPAASGIDDLTDVDTSSSPPSIGNILEWDGNNWVPGVNLGSDERVKVSSNDTTEEFLEDKLVGVINKIDLSVLNEGGDESLQVGIGSDVFDKVVDDIGDILSDYDDVIFVGKHGNDSNDGRNIEHAFLTIGAALTVAEALVTTAGNPILIYVVDGNIYEEDLTFDTPFIVLFAPAATLSGVQTIGDDVTLIINKLFTEFGVGGVTLLKNSGTGFSDVVCNNLIAEGTTVGIGVTTGTLHFIGSLTAENNFAAASVVTSGDLVLDCPFINITGTGTAVGLLGPGRVIGRIGFIHDTGSGTGITVSNASAVVRLTMGSIECSTAIVGTNGTLDIFVADIVGTVTEGSATLNIKTAVSDKGEMFFEGNITATTFSGPGVYTKVLGTTTAGDLRNFTMSADNTLTYNGTHTKIFEVKASASITSAVSGLKTYRIGIHSDSGSGATLITGGQGRVTKTANTAVAAHVTARAFLLLSPGDTVELFILNETNTHTSTVGYMNVNIHEI